MCPFITKIESGVCINLRDKEDKFVIKSGEQIQIESDNNVKIKLAFTPSCLTCEVNVPEASGAFCWIFEEQKNQYHLINNDTQVTQYTSLLAMISNLRIELNGRL